MPPCYVIGSSWQINHLTDVERQHLDASEWVFVCNSFLSHWEAAGFRPSVWVYGDNHNEINARSVEVEFEALANDPRLQERLKYCFVCQEQWGQVARVTAQRWGIDALFYRRTPCWHRNDAPATSVTGMIYHYGSTLTNLVNLAWLLNPGQEIRIFGNEYGGRSDHFWQPERRFQGEAKVFWERVKTAMWRGLADLYHQHHYPLVDCNPTHEWDLPREWRLPHGWLLD